MAHDIQCWKCGTSLASLSLPLRRLEVCPACRAELHVCKLCVEYDTTRAKRCREPTAEEVRDKERANFCDHFRPKPKAWIKADTAALEAVKSDLAKLFGG